MILAKNGLFSVRGLCSAFAVVAALLFAAPAVAQENKYVIRDVAVDVTAEDANQARMQAMTQAEGIAFDQLLAQLLPADQIAAKKSSTTPEKISSMVRGYEVHDEKITATRYQAKMDITFSPDLVSSIVGGGQTLSQNVPAQPSAPPLMQVSSGKSVLLLPVKKNKGGSELWEDDNNWRTVWNNIDRSKSTIVRLPVGDSSDKTMLPPQQISSASFESFNGIAERYQAGSVLVAEASYDGNSEPATLEVKLRTISAGGNADEGLVLNYAANLDEKEEDVMRRAAQDILERIATQGASSPPPVALPASATAESRVTILSKLNALNDWVILRKRLLSLPNIEKVELSAISNSQADIILYFRGSPDALSNSMAAQGLQVSKAYNYWVVAF